MTNATGTMKRIKDLENSITPPTISTVIDLVKSVEEGDDDRKLSPEMQAFVDKVCGGD